MCVCRAPTWKEFAPSARFERFMSFSLEDVENGARGGPIDEEEDDDSSDDDDDGAVDAAGGGGAPCVSCAPYAVSRPILRRRVDEQHCPRSYSIFLRAGPKPRAVLAGWPVTFTAGPEDFYCDRLANFGSQPRRTGPGGGSGIVTDALLTTLLACWCLYNHYIVWGCGRSTLWPR